MKVPTASEVLARVESELEELPRVALCQIVGVQGSTPGKRGWKMLVRPDGTSFGNLGGGAFEALVNREAAALLESSASSKVERYYLTEDAVKGQATGMVCGGMVEVFLEVISARPLLVVCGGGPVGQALAQQAALCDFEVAIAEDRPDFRRPELFPDGTSLLVVDRGFEGDFLGPRATRDLYVAVVSRCWESDLAAAAAVIRAEPRGLRYIGLMGSRRKIDRVVQGLVEKGLGVEGLPWHAPIGLEIGGSTPAEIAVSIVAELIRERSHAEQVAASDGAGNAVQLV